MGQVELLLDELERREPDQYTSPGWVMGLVATDLARYGRSQEARRLADRAIEWCRNRDPDGFRAELSELFLVAGRPTEAVDILQTLVEADPGEIHLHRLLGIAYAMSGDSVRAQKEVTWLEELDRPHLFGLNTYARAAILAHMGRPDDAVRGLRQALEEGVGYEMPSSVVDFMPLWSFGPFEQLMAPRR
jgi:Flp pilus assembly protein TadD